MDRNLTDLGAGDSSSGSLVEDVEDEHYHPQHEDGTVEGSISRMPGLFPKTMVIHRDYEHHLQTPL
jgi:hypothetical protein